MEVKCVANYVKFLRGTVGAYNNLKTKHPDTLYFVYEDESSVSGKMYLGEKLVSSNATQTEVVQYFRSLLDVNVEDAKYHDILTYDSTQEKWIPKSLAQLLHNVPMIGATNEQDGKSGMVPIPKKGDQNKFLKGDGTWGQVEELGSVLTENINKKASIEDVIKIDKKIINIEAELNSWMKRTENIEDQLEIINQDIEDLKKSTTWIKL